MEINKTFTGHLKLSDMMFLNSDMDGLPLKFYEEKLPLKNHLFKLQK